MSNIPSWLKRMENGAIGEARTKEILIDRFWILERSVDIHGADFIIQRRIFDKNVIDVEPPRFGIVQAKFIQDENTNIYIDRDYITDAVGRLRSEFFLIVHTGIEDKKKAFFLTTELIANDFKIVEKGENENKYRIDGKTILSNTKYAISSNTYVNGYVENALLKAELVRNRVFVDRYYSEDKSITKKNIDYEYTYDIFGYDYPIPDVVYNYKKAASRLLENFREYAYYLDKIISETNAEKIIEYLEYLNSEFCGYGSNPQLSFYVSGLVIDSDIIDGFNNYKRKVEILKKKNKLQYFLRIRGYIYDCVKEHYFKSKLKIDNMEDEIKKPYFQRAKLFTSNSILHITINYAVDGEKVPNVKGKVIISKELFEKYTKNEWNETVNIVNNTPENIELYFLLSFCGNLSISNTDEYNINEICQFIGRDTDDIIIDTFTDAL